MRKVSTLFKQTMEKRRDFYASAEIAFADGSEKTLEKRDFALSGNTVTESAESTSFPLGILAGRRITITLENGDDRWSKYDFFGAKIALKTRFDLPDGTTESLNIGTFTVISPESYGETVSITAMDGSYKTDKPYTTAQAYPMTAGVALQDACRTCDIDLATPDFANDDFLIQQAPKDITFRQYIGCIAMLAGGNAVMDEFDRLTIKAYDFTPFERFSGLNGGEFDQLSADRYMTGDTANGGSFNPWSTGDTADGGAFGDRDDTHVLYQFSGVPVIESDDVVITGIQFTNEDEEGNQTAHLYGSDGYVLALENPLLAGQEDAAAALIGAKIVGLRFRPFSGNHIALPTAQFMDLAWILDRKGNGHQSVITDVDFTYFGYTVLKCAADSPIRNSSTYYGQATKAVVQARQMAEKERTDRQKALDTLAQELAQSSGLHMTQERQEDSSTIYYMHDKPTLKDSTIVWKLTANAFGISTDGGKSYPYVLDATGTAILNRIYAIGLNADYINAGRLEVRDESGSTTFLADTKTGEVQIVARSFSLTSGDTIGSIAEEAASSAAGEALKNANSYTDESASSTLASANSHSDSAAADALAGAKEYTDETAESTLTDANEYSDTAASGALESAKGYADKSLSDFVDKTYDPKIAELQKQIDGQIENYFYDYVPTLNNAPANGWTDETEKAKHEGDIFYNKTTGYAYRFFKDGNTWKWQLIQDTDITKAIEAAAAAQDTADHKRRTFLTTPTTPYDEGDIWMQGDSGDIMVCVSSRQNGEYVPADWGKRNKYIDQAAANTAAGNAVKAQTQLDILNKLTNGGKDKGIYLQDGKLYISFSAAKGGAISISTPDGKETLYADSDTGEVRISANQFSLASGDTIESIAEGKASSAADDALKNANRYTDSSASSALASANSHSDSVAAGALESAKGYADGAAGTALSNAKSYADTAAANAVSGQTQTDILNKLTNGGVDNGIYLQNGKLYISFNAAQGGELTLGGANNGNGVLRALNSSGNQYFTLDNAGFLLETRFISVASQPDLYIDMRPDVFEGVSLHPNEDFTGDVLALSNKSISVVANNTNPSISNGLLLKNNTYITPGKMWICGPNSYPGALEDVTFISHDSISSGGSKSRIISTRDYGSRLQYCYEMPSPMFGDIGEGKTDADGNCYVFLDDVFAETVNTNCQYQVFLQKEGPGDLWVSQKEQTYFVASGTPNLGFSWEIKMKQRDYEIERLEQFEPPTEYKEPDYINQAANMVQNLYKEWEEPYNEEDNQLYTLGNRRG